MLSVLLLFALAAPVEASATCSFARPPRWPSFCFQAFDKDAIQLVQSGISPPPAGTRVFGWMGTEMPGYPIRVWVHTRPNEPGVHSYNLHGDALARPYAEVEAWLEEREKGKPGLRAEAR